MRLWIWFSGLTRHAKPGQKALMQKHWCHNHCFCMFMRAVCILCVCVWSCCLKESSSDGAWKPCSAAVLPMHRQLHCWALNTRSALTLARTLYPSLWISLSLLFLSFHVLCLSKPFRLNPYIAPSNGSYIHFSYLTDSTSVPWPCLSQSLVPPAQTPAPRMITVQLRTSVRLNALLTSQS